MFSWVIFIMKETVKTFYKKYQYYILIILLLFLVFAVWRHNKLWHWLTVNTGSVADWVGSVSIPVVLTYFSYQYTAQKDQREKEYLERQEREKEQKEKEEEKSAIQKLQLDLLTMMMYELPKNYNLSLYQHVLKNNLALIDAVRDKTLYYGNKDATESLFQQLKRVIDMARDDVLMNSNQLDFVEKTLRDSLSALEDMYYALDEKE
ncbi:hypothetical protein Lreu23DRAFT_4215 [Limosilactobacillus reuteri subsp. rodentium]|uniref:Uncharacterized protein n=2 Tax=Limosilactobacillus reuteri TaxID=1598 RepID=B3XNJ3_LIMR1|nr:hypothetical protein Lreu23DRAFT_4215 [Limosilactobacillus reuteri subsp. rodentium]